MRKLSFVDESTYPAKEVLTPVTETLFYFTEDEYRESKLKDDRELLIFARACDINAIKILDQIYLENGGIEDYFYKEKETEQNLC